MKAMQSIGLAITLMLVAPSQSWSQTANINDDAWKQFVNQTTVVVASLYPERLAISEESSNFAAQARQLRNLVDELDGAVMHLILDLPYSSAQPAVRIVLHEPDEQKRDKLAQRFADRMLMKVDRSEDCLVIVLGESGKYASQPVNERGLNEKVLQQVERPGLDAAFDKVKSSAIQIAFAPPGYLWQSYEQLLEKLPPQLGGGKPTELTHGMQWAALGIDLERLIFTATIQSSSPAAAMDFTAYLPKLIRGLLSLQPSERQAELNRLVEAGLPLLDIKANDDQVQIAVRQNAEIAAGFSLLAALAKQAFDTLPGHVVKDRLRQIALAIHNYESVYGVLPPGRNNEKTIPSSRLSWRVQLLPFLDQNELYQKFKHDEPWDSPHNIQLLAEIPEVYRSPMFASWDNTPVIQPGYTPFVAPVGEGTIFGGNEVLGFRNVSDGLSNTAMVLFADSNHVVPWTAPDDYRYEASNPAKGLKQFANGLFVVAVGDGSVQMIPLDTDPEQLRRLFIRNDGQPLQLP